ncbi:hypothetical protein [uncultured Thiodictyon sp.]|uniref:hypothetical protein n=1 Tax=uncultured Thiodictyon sp. TaxID=1846217 RepID=UPI0025D6C328|nr:hypothetical protein [uncultured Thiodictyon sp.]
MKTRYTSVGLALTLAGYAVTASAVEPSATLKQLNGRVFVAQAAATGLARNTMPLYAGNRVMAVTGGAAQVVYPDGCTVALPENSMLVIGAADQCRTGQALVRTTAGFQDKAVGQVVRQSLSAFGQSFVDNFATMNAQQLVDGYAALGADQAAVLANLTDLQLTDLYMATAAVQGPAAANTFLATLPAATQGAVYTAAGAAAGASGAAGVVIGTASVGALGTAAIATAATAAAVAAGTSGATSAGTVVPIPGPSSK